MSKYYILMPSEYVQKLQLKGKKNRKKARSFMEYFYDLEQSEDNSERFYALSWEVSPSTAHEWIKEFKKEIDIFLDGWKLRNKNHFQSTQKPSSEIYGQKSAEQKSSKNTPPQPLNIGNLSNQAEQKSSEVFNIYSSNNKEFIRQMNELRFLVGKYLGNIEEIYKTYKEMSIEIDLKVLVYAYRKYHESLTLKDKILGLANFIKQSLYLSYLPTEVKIGEIKGFLDIENQIFITDNQNYKITTTSLLQKLEKKEVEFII